MSLLTHQSFANSTTPYWASAVEPTTLISPTTIRDKQGNKKVVITANPNGTGGVFYANNDGTNPFGIGFAQGATQVSNQLIFDVGNVLPIMNITSSNVVSSQPIVLDTGINAENFTISQTASNTVLAQGVSGGTIQMSNNTPAVSINDIVVMDGTGLIQTTDNASVDLYINPSKQSIYISNVITGAVAIFGASGSASYLGTGLPPVTTPAVLANQYNGAELRFSDGSVNVYGIKETSGNLLFSSPSVSNAITIAPSGQVTIPDIVSGSFVPIGGIIMFSGSVGSLPPNWKVCDGTNGTPDLTNKFVIGAGTFASGTAGGSNIISISNLPSHGHSIVDLTHSHTVYTAGSSDTFGRVGGTTNFAKDLQTLTTSSASTGITKTDIVVTSDSNGTVATIGQAYYPPFYALAYIMRVS